MGLRVFDFQCVDGHRNEMFVEADTLSMQCVTCGKIAQRMIAAPRCQLEGITGAFPGAALKWEANRESHMRKEQKHKEKHGTWT